MSHGSRRRARLLLLLTLLFAARVAGQLTARGLEPRWLPPFELWHSGLLPYGWLVAAQVAILAVQVRILVDVARGGPWAAPVPCWVQRWGPRLRTATWIYAGVMFLRYPAMALVAPDRSPAAGLIPIAFHLVLAGFLLRWTAVPVGGRLPARAG